MGLPAAFKGLHKRDTSKSSSNGSFDASSDGLDEKDNTYWYKQDLRLNTRARRTFVILASVLYLIAWVFLLLVRFLVPDPSAPFPDTHP